MQDISRADITRDISRRRTTGILREDSRRKRIPENR